MIRQLPSPVWRQLPGFVCNSLSVGCVYSFKTCNSFHSLEESWDFGRFGGVIPPGWMDLDFGGIFAGSSSGWISSLG